MFNRNTCSMTRTTFTIVVTGLLLTAVAVVGCQKKPSQLQQSLNVAVTEEYTPVATTVNVTLKSNAIDMPDVIGSGWSNIVIQNADSVAHAFGVRGNGVDRLLPDSIAPGQMQTLRIELRPGTYEVTCPDCGPGLGPVARQLVVAQW